MYTLLFSIITAVYSTMWPLSAPPLVKVVSGLARQDNFVPSRRFREDGLEDLKLSTGGGRQSNYSWRSTLAVAEQPKPINGDSLQVHVEPVVSTP